MKKLLKIFSITLALCLLVSTFGYAASFSDVTSDSNYSSAVSLLSGLGIINGYEDGTFGPEKNVTRAEFTAMLMRTLGQSGIGNSDPASLPFKDLTGVDWAISDISTAYQQGIINGMSDVEFAPNEEVTHEQALKMIVCALGYQQMAIDLVGGEDKVWPDGYTGMAGQLKINDLVTSPLTNSAKRWEIAQYIYNSLEVSLVNKKTTNGSTKYEIDDSKNILNDKLKIYYTNAELMANETESILSTAAVAKSGELILQCAGETNTETFENVNKIDTKGIVGRTVKCYYKVNSNYEKELVYIEDKTKDSSILTISDDQYENLLNNGTWNGLVVEYWEEETDRSISQAELDNSPIVTINGRAIDLNTVTPATAFNIDSGSIELIDSDSNGKYDKVNITSYQTYVVKSVNTTDKLIIDNYRNSTQNNSYKIDVDDPLYTISIKNAETKSNISFSSLTAWNVVSIKETIGANGKVTLDVLVSTKSVTGTVTMVDKDGSVVAIDGKEYDFSRYFETYGGNDLTSLAVDDTAKFYLDKDGKIAAYDKTSASSETYAYLCGVAFDSSSEEATFKFIEPSGSRTTLYGANKIRVDGTSYSKGTAVTNILAAASNISGTPVNGSQMVKLTKNSSNEVSAIDTVAVNASPSDSDFALFKSGLSYTYNSNSKEFKSGSTTFKIDSSTIIYSVPNTRTSYSDYVKRSTSFFKDGSTYAVEAYDVTGSLNKVKALAVYGASSSGTLYADSGLLVLDSKNKTTNASLQEIYNLSGYVFDSSIAYSSTLSTHKTTDNVSAWSDFVSGDVARYALSDDVIFNANSRKILSVEGPMVASMYNGLTDITNNLTATKTSDYIVAHGYLIGADDTSFKIAITSDINDMITTEQNLITGTPYTLPYRTETFTTASDTIYLKYEGGQNSPLSVVSNLDLTTVPSFEDVKSLLIDENGQVLPTASGVNIAEIFVYEVKDHTRLVYYIIR